MDKITVLLNKLNHSKHVIKYIISCMLPTTERITKEVHGSDGTKIPRTTVWICFLNGRTWSGGRILLIRFV